MGERYLIDTNSVIELLSANLPDLGIDFLERVIQLNVHCLSVINRIELLSYRGSSEEIQLLNDFHSDRTRIQADRRHYCSND